MTYSHTIVEKTAYYVQDTLTGAEGGHDWFHTYRVWKSAIHIGQEEGADLYTVELAALLHDIADSKFHGGDEEIGPRTAGIFLDSLSVDIALIEHVQNIIANVSFKGGNAQQTFHSKELEVVQDADRLDALGAVGIARTFAYGGFKEREIYNPTIPPSLNMTKEEYKNSTAPSINHFYEKLLLLKDRMNTRTGREMAEHRHKYMQEYLNEFYKEWDGIL